MSTRRELLRGALAGGALLGMRSLGLAAEGAGAGRPNVILVMTDDQGWGDTGYNGHPTLKTPALDEMAGAGIRFDRFYAAAPVCSPTRGSVLTGRHPNRFGCFTHGMPIRREEVTLAQALKAAGYRTGHFGKWHLNGVVGPGMPIPAEDPLNPGKCGFDEWLSVSNFFDLNPMMARNGKPEQLAGDGSDIIVAEALKFIAQAAREKQPFFAVVWFGSPHNPHRALPEDAAAYGGNHYLGEMRAVDRGVGHLRRELRRLGIAENTVVWFNSDNGAIPQGSSGGLRGGKSSLWEGGIRVPGIVEWPARIRRPFATSVPCGTVDIYPTILELTGAAMPANQPRPLDGMSLAPLLEGQMPSRPRPLAFWVYQGGQSTLVDNDWKLHLTAQRTAANRRRAAALPPVLLYNLAKDRAETTDLAAQEPARVEAMRKQLEEWKASVERSLAGGDYRAAG